jgi:hypothetical protein
MSKMLEDGFNSSQNLILQKLQRNAMLLDFVKGSDVNGLDVIFKSFNFFLKFVN